MQAGASHGADDTGIMDDLDFDAEFDCSEIQVRVRGGTKGIADYQKGIIVLFVFGNFGLKHAINLDLTEVPVGLNDRHLEKSFEIFIGCAHD